MEKTNKDVEAVEFKDSVVEYFPRGLKKIFPRLIALRIINCGLLEITREDLKGLKDLKMLNLSKNELISLPDDLLFDMTNLEAIQLDGNKIRHMSSEVLKPMMKTIEVTNFSKNKRIGSYSINSNSPDYETTPVKDLMEKIDKLCEPPLLLKTSKHVFCVKLAKGFERLWLSGQLSDFTIKVGAKKFPVHSPVHKIVLAFGSSEFAKLFADENLPKEVKEIIIEGLQEKSVEDFLRFLYTSCIPDEINVEEVFSLAAKLDVPELREIIEKAIEDEIGNSDEFKVFKEFRVIIPQID